mmetsp:Transcript_125249/g.354480  ORF Transcript_125249/g.354480 Transcript_125249/m.354480 type:complete len:254 (+) Transcript_125249:53-814(+)
MGTFCPLIKIAMLRSSLARRAASALRVRVPLHARGRAEQPSHLGPGARCLMAVRSARPGHAVGVGLVRVRARAVELHVVQLLAGALPLGAEAGHHPHLADGGHGGGGEVGAGVECRGLAPAGVAVRVRADGGELGEGAGRAPGRAGRRREVREERVRVAYERGATFAYAVEDHHQRAGTDVGRQHQHVQGEDGASEVPQHREARGRSQRVPAAVPELLRGTHVVVGVLAPGQRDADKREHARDKGHCEIGNIH